jgi:hypothetical protein
MGGSGKGSTSWAFDGPAASVRDAVRTPIRATFGWEWRMNFFILETP